MNNASELDEQLSKMSDMFDPFMNNGYEDFGHNPFMGNGYEDFVHNLFINNGYDDFGGHNPFMDSRRALEDSVDVSKRGYEASIAALVFGVLLSVTLLISALISGVKLARMNKSGESDKGSSTAKDKK
jgi:hypothetical protein